MATSCEWCSGLINKKEQKSEGSASETLARENMKTRWKQKINKLQTLQSRKLTTTCKTSWVRVSSRHDTIRIPIRPTKKPMDGYRHTKGTTHPTRGAIELPRGTRREREGWDCRAGGSCREEGVGKREPLKCLHSTDVGSFVRAV